MSSRSSLTKQSINAVKWSAFGNIARYGLQLAAQIVLARLLGSANYGLFALGLTVLGFSNMLANFGLAWGLVQAQDLNEEDVRFVFTWQLVSGLIAALTLYLLASTIAAFFNDVRLESIVEWLSLACIISAANAPASNLLRRKLDFKSINLIEISSYIIGYIVIGVPLAYNGAGVWSLVTAWLIQAFCALIFSFIRCPHPIKPLFWHQGASTLVGVGSTVFVTNICNWLLNNLDRTLLGRFLNVQSVGLYSVGYNLANTPNSLLIGALQPAFLAAGARIQSDSDRLRSAYLSVLASIWILILPMFIMLAILAQDLVGLLYGSAWLSSGMVLAILALSMPAYITWGMSTPILWNTGRKHWESLLQLPILVAAGLAYFNFASQGVVMVTLIAAGTLLARAIVITSAACHLLKIALKDLVGFAIRGIAMATLASAGTLAGCEIGRITGIAMTPIITLLGFDFSQMAGAAHFYALLAGVPMGCGVLIATSLIYPRLLGSEVIKMLGRFSPSLLGFLERRLHSTITPRYALLVGMFISCGILIAPTIVYPPLSERALLQVLERFSESLFTLAKGNLEK